MKSLTRKTTKIANQVSWILFIVVWFVIGGVLLVESFDKYLLVLGNIIWHLLVFQILMVFVGILTEFNLE